MCLDFNDKYGHDFVGQTRYILRQRDPWENLEKLPKQVCGTGLPKGRGDSFRDSTYINWNWAF